MDIPSKRPKMDILIVDDDDGVRTLLGEVINSMGLKYESAASGKEGFGMAMDNSYRLILMDLMMDDWDGFYAIESLETCNEHCKVIVVSANVDDEATKRLGDRPNVVAVVDKPFSTEALSKLVRDALS